MRSGADKLDRPASPPRVPRARDSVREAVKSGIAEYAIWLDGRRGAMPDLSSRYQQFARRIYRDFIAQFSRRGNYRNEVHTGGTDPQVYEGDNAHRGSNDR